MMRDLLVKLGLRLARLGGWTQPVCRRPHEFVCPLPHGCNKPHLPPIAQTEDTKRFVEHVAVHFPGTSGEFKRREVLRALLNTFPKARERDCALAIELVMQERT